MAQDKAHSGGPLYRPVSVKWEAGELIFLQSMFTAGSHHHPNQGDEDNTPFAATGQIEVTGENSDISPIVNGPCADFHFLLTGPSGGYALFATQSSTWKKIPASNKLDVHDPTKIDMNDDLWKNFYAFSFSRIAQDVVTNGFHVVAYNDTIVFNLKALLPDRKKFKKPVKITLKFWQGLGGFEGLQQLMNVTVVKAPKLKDAEGNAITPPNLGTEIIIHPGSGFFDLKYLRRTIQGSHTFVEGTYANDSGGNAEGKTTLRGRKIDKNDDQNTDPFQLDALDVQNTGFS